MGYLRYGEVVTARISPEDILSCLDVVEKLGIPTRGMSLSMAIKVALSAVMEGMRANGALPRHEGFDYENRVRPYLGQPRAIKAQYAHAMSKAQASRMVRELPGLGKKFSPQEMFEMQEKLEAAPDITEVDRKRARVLVRLAELSERRRADPDNFTLDMQRQFEAFELAHKTLQEGVDLDVSELFARWS